MSKGLSLEGLINHETAAPTRFPAILNTTRKDLLMFGHKKKIYVTLSADHTELYQGPWNDLPLAEELIIAKSIEFFDDANPCFIHRDAVRVRLLAELEEAIPALQGDMPPEWLSLLSEYMGIEITHAAFYYK